MIKSFPWIEKYRPSNIGEIVHQKDAVKTLFNVIKSGDLPHLLFYGPPGTGKTTAIIALAKELFGAELYSHRVMELNASDERGIQMIREKVKSFAQWIVTSVKSE